MIAACVNYCECEMSASSTIINFVFVLSWMCPSYPFLSVGLVLVPDSGRRLFTIFHVRQKTCAGSSVTLVHKHFLLSASKTALRALKP